MAESKAKLLKDVEDTIQFVYGRTRYSGTIIVDDKGNKQIEADRDDRLKR
jgi:hypothetical protein